MEKISQSQETFNKMFKALRQHFLDFRQRELSHDLSTWEIAKILPKCRYCCDAPGGVIEIVTGNKVIKTHCFHIEKLDRNRDTKRHYPYMSHYKDLSNFDYMQNWLDVMIFRNKPLRNEQFLEEKGSKKELYVCLSCEAMAKDKYDVIKHGYTHWGAYHYCMNNIDIRKPADVRLCEIFQERIKSAL